MFYPRKAHPSRGQRYRDKVRIESLERSGYRVHTMDNKHESVEGKEGECLTLHS